ncbi:MAG: nicotinate-nucleotide pyrophosphorylase [Proteobacteria bacterium]|nr:nicotinate-nucleotide pyrophosphorylase [Pseudomonadota bacterium]MBU4383865.1 nicotinate-nucleotide pyrophosphorylase [Pseudomonadota bacterium]
MNWWPPDIRQRIFDGHQDRLLRAQITAEKAGVLSGMARAKELAAKTRVSFDSNLTDGDQVFAGQVVATLTGTPFYIVRAEELLLGELSKTSGIATQARQALEGADGRFLVVCGAFKKMPHAIKDQIRQAVAHGGLRMRMAPHPFVYVDKNYVRILGGVAGAMEAVAPLERPVVIQLRGELEPIAQEAVTAARMGAATLMVDTGDLDDLEAASQALRREGLREKVKLAFAGNLRLTDLPGLTGHDVDSVDIGYSVVDAPCLPMRFDVIKD